MFYVWFDALTDYMSAVEGKDLWPADLHLIGKEILRFHGVFWPAFLMAAELPLPKKIFAHGWLLFEESKMSKSRGNIVRSEPIRQVMGADALRYFLLREVVFGQDGSFSYEALIGRYNSELANGLGNLVSRTLTMIGQYRAGAIPAGTVEPIADAARQTIADVVAAFDALEFTRGLEAVWVLLSKLDKFIVERAPWKMARQPDAQADLDATLYTAAEALRVATVLLSPVLPESTPKIWTQLGMAEPLQSIRLDALAWGQLPTGQKIGEVSGVFPRIEAKEAIAKMQELEVRVTEEQNAMLGKAPKAEPAAAAPASDRITIDDFAKVDMRVGQVISAEPVKGADKLLHLKVDIGEQQPPHHRSGHRRSLPARPVDRPQSGNRRQPATAQAARHRIERHDRGRIAGRRQAGAGGLPGRRTGGSAPQVKLIDSHCHLDDEQFDADRAEVIERARQPGWSA